MEETFEKELMNHIEFLNLLAMSEDDEYEKKQMMKLIVEMTKELNGGEHNEINS